MGFVRRVTTSVALAAVAAAATPPSDIAIAEFDLDDTELRKLDQAIHTMEARNAVNTPDEYAACPAPVIDAAMEASSWKSDGNGAYARAAFVCCAR
jgi:hypothetical protein